MLSSRCLPSSAVLRWASASSAKRPKGKAPPKEANQETVGPAASLGFTGRIPMDQVKVAYCRSSGPGGQHVNTTASKAEVRFAVEEASWMGEERLRQAFVQKYRHRLNAKGELVVRSERTRVQGLNVADALDKIRFSIREVAEEIVRDEAPPSEKAAEKWRSLEAKAARERLHTKQRRRQLSNARNMDF